VRPAILAVAVALLTHAGLARAAELDVRFAVAPGDWVVAQLGVEGLLDDELIDALESGLPTRLRYEVELWRDRRRFWDELELSEVLEYRIHYDLLEESYRVFDAVGGTVVDDADEETLRRLLERDELELLGLEELDGEGKYYLVAKLKIEPLSVEEIRDLENWLRGRVSSRGDGGISGISGHLIGILRNEVGLGGREFEARSLDYDLRGLQKLREESE